MATLRQMWEGWKRIAIIIGNVQARIILTVLYLILVMPLGLIVRAVSDPLRLRRPGNQSANTYWSPRSGLDDTAPDDLLEEAWRQF